MTHKEKKEEETQAEATAWKTTRRVNPTFDAKIASPSESKWMLSLASPRGVMILVPLLVLSLGVVFTIIGQIALSGVSEKMVKKSFLLQTSSVSRGLSNTLGQAEPLLDELVRIARGATIHPPLLATEVDHKRLLPGSLEMRDLLIGRPGITQAYIAFADGSFWSADRTDENKLQFQITSGGVSSVYRIEGSSLRAVQTGPSNYDPRKRSWYRLAETKGRRVWSPPYSSYHQHHTGVTRAHPVYEKSQRGELMAVVGVDFNVNTLTTFMAASESPADAFSTAVFTDEGVVLAYPRGEATLARLPKSNELVTHEIFDDPALSSLVATVQELAPGGGASGFVRYRQGDVAMLASIDRVGADVPGWFVATFASEKLVLRELYAHRKSSLLIGLVALLIALSVGWLFARHILNVRRFASRAQEAVRQAKEHIRQLGSYQLLSLIGEGGMGEVWRGRHILLARHAAIKLIKEGADKSQRKLGRERFKREARAIAGLRSRNTIDLYDYGVTTDGTLFFVMELLDGIDLNRLIQKHGPQSPERVRQILIQVCNSLSEAHEAQLVHRDIKPANLFLCREAAEVDVVKVLDFGLVSQSEPVLETSDNAITASENQTPKDELDTKTSAEASAHNASYHWRSPAYLSEQGQSVGDYLVGTPAFMSPEQALGEKTDSRSDIYSLGCVAWWLLRSELVFSAEGAMAMMLKHIESPLPKLTQTDIEATPGPLWTLILSCLEKSPASRPQSALELQVMLKEMGPLDAGWTEADARHWWGEHMPRRTDPHLKLSAPPLHDIELLGPTEST